LHNDFVIRKKKIYIYKRQNGPFWTVLRGLPLLSHGRCCPQRR